MRRTALGFAVAAGVMLLLVLMALAEAPEHPLCPCEPGQPPAEVSR